MGPQTSADSLPHSLPWFAYFLYFCYLLRDICLLTLPDPRGYWGRESCLQALSAVTISGHQYFPSTLTKVRWITHTFENCGQCRTSGSQPWCTVLPWRVSTSQVKAGLRATGPEQLSDLSLQQDSLGASSHNPGASAPGR